MVLGAFGLLGLGAYAFKLTVWGLGLWRWASSLAGLGIFLSSLNLRSFDFRRCFQALRVMAA